jgi:hypothetical protein
MMVENPRKFVLIAMATMVFVVPVLYTAFDAAGQDVRLAGAIGVLAALAVSTVLTIALMVRVAKGGTDEETSKRLMLRRAKWHGPILFATPLFVYAAHPWGLASIAVGAGALVACQAITLHAAIIVGVLFRKRARGPQTT